MAGGGDRAQGAGKLEVEAGTAVTTGQKEKHPLLCGGDLWTGHRQTGPSVGFQETEKGKGQMRRRRPPDGRVKPAHVTEHVLSADCVRGLHRS